MSDPRVEAAKRAAEAALDRGKQCLVAVRAAIDTPEGCTELPDIAAMLGSGCTTLSVAAEGNGRLYTSQEGIMLEHRRIAGADIITIENADRIELHGFYNGAQSLQTPDVSVQAQANEIKTIVHNNLRFNFVNGCAIILDDN